ncbi:MAG: hypothetical protein II126_02075 [Erysipelotrichaceae bacterium]|nr:hypothetical protein [Erysipelotrichaceae bacterium]
MNNLRYIFVHGLSGWGSYDSQYEKMPYWGMRGGDLMKKLRQEGVDCYAASVHPSRSAYDRACELYAQLTGTLTDYGKNHSEINGHPQYGPDFRGRPLIDRFDESTRLVLIGHSFGGATIRMFAHMMAYGNPDEQESQSALFKGGMADNIFALVAIAAPHNGTTAYDMYEDPDFDISSIRIPLSEKMANRLMSVRTSASGHDVSPQDTAAFDMHIDNALKLNQRIRVPDNAYCFSQPCSATDEKNGNQVPADSLMELIYRRSSRLMGAYSGKTAGGFETGDDWKENDGLVNTISASYPFYQPHQKFDENDIRPGIWNVFDPVRGDHIALQGGLMRPRDILPYYRRMISLINGLYERSM